MAKKLIDALTMEISDNGDCSKIVAFTIDEATAVRVQASAAAFIGSYVQIPGFRAGKAPLDFVTKKYGSSIDEEVTNRYIRAAFQKMGQVLTDDQIYSVRQSGTDKPVIGKEFKFSFEVLLKPEFELGDYQSITVDTALKPVEDSEIDKQVDQMCEQYAGFEPVQTAAAGDMMKVDYAADFALPEDASEMLKHQVKAADSYLWLEEPEQIPGSVKALIGAETGKEYKFTAEYAADYKEAALAGQKVEYTVTVKEIKHRQKLTVEQLNEKLNGKLDEYRKYMRTNMEAQNKQLQLQEAGEAAYAKLDELTAKFPVPKALVDAEVEKIVNGKAGEAKRENEKITDDELKEKLKEKRAGWEAEAAEPAAKAVRRQFILRKLAEAEKIVLSEELVNEEVDRCAGYFGYKNPGEFRSMAARNGFTDLIRGQMYEQAALNKLAEAALPKPAEA